MTTREALADVTLNGLFIPKGGVVYIDIHGIQRSPKYWQQPLQFMPERFLDKVGECKGWCVYECGGGGEEAQGSGHWCRVLGWDKSACLLNMYSCTCGRFN
jgi:cytochrome P450